MRKLLVIIAACTSAGIASGQILSIGAIGGVPITDTTGRTSQSRPYTVGGSVELHLPLGLAIEADALYRRVGGTFFYGGASLATGTVAFDRERGNSWEFPLIGKYYFHRSSAWQPFVGTGYAFRTIGVNDSGTTTTNDSTGVHVLPFTGSYRTPLEVGATVVGGVRLHYSHLAILPQIRYTRWSGSSFLVRNNETSFLLGVTF